MTDPRTHLARIPLTTSLRLILTRPRLLGWSLLLFTVTLGLTWLVNTLALNSLDGLFHSFLPAEPAATGLVGTVKHYAWLGGEWLYLLLSRIIIFYLAFLAAWTIATPGFSFLSRAAEKTFTGTHFTEDAAFTLPGTLRDLMEGCKMALFGVVISLCALLLNLIPMVGQLAAFLLYCGYSALLFIDFPASRRRWPLGKKLTWLRQHKGLTLRLGLLPALISLLPLVNIFAMALIFPLLTVHASLNFVHTRPDH